jgi:CDP-glycerol glycerophosphotransferase (TagB/SpsB family)
MPRVVRYLLCVAFLPIYCISFIVPRKRNLWVFGCWRGQKFADNPKYLFLYVNKNHPEIRAIWLTHRAEVVQELSRQGYEAYKALSLKGFLCSLSAGCAVISHGVDDINGFALGKAKKIHLCHSTLLKKILYDGERVSFLMPGRRKGKVRTTIAELANEVYPLSMFHYDVLAVASEEAKEKVSSAFRDSKNRLYVTGYPRNDALFDTPWLTSNQCGYLDNIKKQVSFKYVIAYLPTFRQAGRGKADLFAKYGFDVSEAQQMLESLNAIFIAKPHHVQNIASLSVRNESPRRIYTPSDGELPDIYPFLKETNILITDYSGVYFDYLLLNRPIIFAPFDIGEYIKETGLYYNYDEVTPGPKAKDWPEIFRLIPEIIENDRWKQEREATCKRFNKFTDNGNSKRVFEMIREILGE